MQLDSQHKCVERPVWPVFPDYLSVPCDYGYINLYKLLKLNGKMFIKILKSRKDKKSQGQQFSQYAKLNRLKETTPANTNKRTN